jgi:hypothetical protein
VLALTGGGGGGTNQEAASDRTTTSTAERSLGAFCNASLGFDGLARGVRSNPASAQDPRTKARLEELARQMTDTAPDNGSLSERARDYTKPFLALGEGRQPTQDEIAAANAAVSEISRACG